MPITINQIAGKRLALVFMGKTSDGADDWAVVAGIAVQQEGALYLQREEGRAPYEIRPEWLPQIQSVQDKIKPILGDADYYLPLKIGAIPVALQDTPQQS